MKTSIDGDDSGCKAVRLSRREEILTDSDEKLMLSGKGQEYYRCFYLLTCINATGKNKLLGLLKVMFFVWGVVCECTEMGLRHLVRGETRSRCQTGDNLKLVIMLQKERVMT